MTLDENMKGLFELMGDIGMMKQPRNNKFGCRLRYSVDVL